MKRHLADGFDAGGDAHRGDVYAVLPWTSTVPAGTSSLQHHCGGRVVRRHLFFYLTLNARALARVVPNALAACRGRRRKDAVGPRTLDVGRWTIDARTRSPTSQRTWPGAQAITSIDTVLVRTITISHKPAGRASPRPDAHCHHTLRGHRPNNWRQQACTACTARWHATNLNLNLNLNLP